MRRIIIFGNSGSGKSTLARKLSASGEFGHLDLDSLAWEAGSTPTRKRLAESEIEIQHFISSNQSWVIEGCYSDLLDLIISQATEIIFTNLPVQACISNARSRPWEPHKYPSKEEQDKNLAMLIDWIAKYEERDDTFSFAAHQALFNKYSGKKRMLTSNAQTSEITLNN